jgi:hypothetical protein
LLSLAPGDLDPVDFTTVTACTLERYKNNALVGTWPTVLSAQTATTATATYTCSADGSDFIGTQQIVIRPVLTVPSGQRYCEPFVIQPKL